MNWEKKQKEVFNTASCSLRSRFKPVNDYYNQVQKKIKKVNVKKSPFRDHVAEVFAFC